MIYEMEFVCKFELLHTIIFFNTVNIYVSQFPVIQFTDFSLLKIHNNVFTFLNLIASNIA